MPIAFCSRCPWYCMGHRADADVREEVRRQLVAHLAEHFPYYLAEVFGVLWLQAAGGVQ